MQTPVSTKNRLIKPLLRKLIGNSLLLVVLMGAFVGLSAMSFLVYQILNTQVKGEIQKTLQIEAFIQQFLITNLI